MSREFLVSLSKITHLCSFFLSFFFVVALKSSNSTRPERNGIQENCRTAKLGEGMQILEGELLLQVCFEMNLLSDHLNSSNKNRLYLTC